MKKIKQLSIKKLYILASKFLWDRYRGKNDIGEITGKIIIKKEMKYLKEFLAYIWKHKNDEDL